MILSKTKFKRK